ncbi:MAG: hypothetical protein AAGB00_09370 [Planctomycetota bacterium]
MSAIQSPVGPASHNPFDAPVNPTGANPPNPGRAPSARAARAPQAATLSHAAREQMAKQIAAVDAGRTASRVGFLCLWVVLLMLLPQVALVTALACGVGHMMLGRHRRAGRERALLALPDDALRVRQAEFERAALEKQRKREATGLATWRFLACSGALVVAMFVTNPSVEKHEEFIISAMEENAIEASWFGAWAAKYGGIRRAYEWTCSTGRVNLGVCSFGTVSVMRTEPKVITMGVLGQVFQIAGEVEEGDE